ncbi:MAG: hypothetical protein AB8H79_04065 [Myxococcota bacterium]
MRSLICSLALFTACNQAPEGLAIEIGPNAATTTDDLVLNITTQAIDPNASDEVTLQIAWSVDGDGVSDLAGERTVPADRTKKGEEWEVSIVATDGKSPAEPVTASVIIANTPPVTTVTVGPDAPVANNDLTAEALGTDADGEDLTVRYTWTQNGSTTSEGGARVDASKTRKGDVWTVTATMSDDEADSEPATASVTVANSTPSVGAARISPLKVYEASVLTCLGAGWKDPDEEDVEAYDVRWRVNGSLASTEPELTGEDFDRGDEVICELTPVDDTSAGEPVRSAGALVRNTPPVIVGGSVTPERPTITSTLQARPGPVTDDDGDFSVMRYQWRVNGDAIGPAASFIKGESGYFSKGDTIDVYMVPFDGQENGLATRITVDINNTPPTAPTARLDLDGDLVCVVDVPSEDADGDTITYAMTWTLDGSPVTSTSTTTWPDDTVASDDLSEGDWACTIEPSDDEETGTSANATLTIESISGDP